MELYNDLTKTIETFKPLAPGSASIYVCGITPYDTTHLGHAFTYTAIDILIRYLELRGLRVKYAQNVTDIDDDILRKAREVGADWKALGNQWTRHFIEDMKSLNVRPPDFFPRATDVIAEMIDTVKALLHAGYAYESGGSVFFHIDAWPEYGKLSGLSREEMLPIANDRGNNPNDPYKRHPLDFVLWQAQATGEPAWDSPWGPGRPGWHIECSTMASRYLGNSVDIHGGGADLVFPHHESEIAQSEGATGKKPFVRFWLHTAMVRHAGEKMSKSLGNLVLVRDLLETWSPDALRLYLGLHHYRESWEHNAEGLKEAEDLAQKLAQASKARSGRGTSLEPAPGCAAFLDAMEHDLGTTAALLALRELTEDILRGARAGRKVRAAQEALKEMGSVFGLRLGQEGHDSKVAAGWNEHLRRFA